MHSNMLLVHNLAIKNLSDFKEVATYTTHKWIHGDIVSNNSIQTLRFEW
jgi:hypothetical protein